jgi:hypothetical protein
MGARATSSPTITRVVQSIYGVMQEYAGFEREDRLDVA